MIKEKRVCLICESDNHLKTLTFPVSGLVECETCGLAFRWPQPTHQELTAYFSEEYPKHFDESKGVYRTGLFSNLLKKIRSLPKGKLLDMGCGFGHFLQLARGEGWEVFGTELSAQMAEAAERRVGVKIHRGVLQEVTFPSASFDLVTLWDVLDLCSDPLEQLIEIHRILKPEGLLFIRLPNFLFHQRAASFSHFLDRWLRLKPSLTLRLTVFHLYSFTPYAIQQLLQKTGFSLMSIRNSRPSYGDPYGAFSSPLSRKGFALLKRTGFFTIQSLYYLSAGRWICAPSMELFVRKSDG